MWLAPEVRAAPLGTVPFACESVPGPGPASELTVLQDASWCQSSITTFLHAGL